jgi:acetylornithine deacetylase/succinyl-diaminopimelate desuccinylase-like protein
MPDGAIVIARDLIAIPSVNPMGQAVSGPPYGEKHVACYVYDYLRKLGVDSRISGRDAEHPNVLGFINVNAQETVLLEAHMDTVSHEEMEIAPFDPILRNGMLYGRGSCDTKSSLAAYLHALSHILGSGKKLRRNVILAGVHNEEYSFAGSRELVAEGLQATFAVVGEPTSLKVVYAHKGICRFRIHTKGRSAHAALFWLGDNAVYRMAGVLKELEAYGQELLAHPKGELGTSTLSVGRIAGGTAVNTVPSLCSIDVDYRLLPGESSAAARDAIRARISSANPEVVIEPPYMEAPGMHGTKDSKPCLALATACHQAKWKTDFITAHYGTDGAIISAAGIPTAVFGPGAIELAHTKAECVPVNEVELASEIIIALLTEA